MAEQYPHEGSPLIKAAAGKDYKDLFKIYSVTYNIPFYFLPYDFKMTENLNPSWNNQSVIGRMDPIMTFKNMSRTIQVQFKARQKLPDGTTPMYYTGDELLHTIDHVKKCLYPRYDSNSVMISPPLFRIQYKNLINAGEDQFEIEPDKGVLGIITAFGANFATEPNKIYFPSGGSTYAYPKVFDINFTFTVMNENLVSTQQTNILNKKYFYNFVHEEDQNHGAPTISDAEGTEASAAAGTGVDPEVDATAAAMGVGSRIPGGNSGFSKLDKTGNRIGPQTPET